MNTFTNFCLRVYAITLCLYPVAFRERYALLVQCLAYPLAHFKPGTPQQPAN
jgi:hypothetical protein